MFAVESSAIGSSASSSPQKKKTQKKNSTEGEFIESESSFDVHKQVFSNFKFANECRGHAPPIA